MKRVLALALTLALLLPAIGAAAETKKSEPLPELYIGRLSDDARVYADREGTQGINQIGSVAKGKTVVIHALDPTFALVTYKDGNLTGYTKRVNFYEEVPQPVDSAATPPFGVDFNHFISVIAAEDAPVTTAPGSGDTLITLHKGAKVSFIGFEEGYGKVIYHRQYGYIDGRLLEEILPVYEAPETAGTDRPIASYTSFYKITTDQSNQNRMTNIGVACGKLCTFPMAASAELNFNKNIGPYRESEGYRPAGVLVDGELKQGYGGGTCQVSSTLYNVVLQLSGLTVLQRRPHGANGAPYLPIGVDAAVGNEYLNFRFRNDYAFPVRIDASAQDGALTIAIYRAAD